MICVSRQLDWNFLVHLFLGGGRKDDLCISVSKWVVAVVVVINIINFRVNMYLGRPAQI